MDTKGADPFLGREPFLRMVLSETHADGSRAILVATDRADRDGSLVRNWELKGAHLDPSQLEDLVAYIAYAVTTELVTRFSVAPPLFPADAD